MWIKSSPVSWRTCVSLKGKLHLAAKNDDQLQLKDVSQTTECCWNPGACGTSYLESQLRSDAYKGGRRFDNAREHFCTVSEFQPSLGVASPQLGFMTRQNVYTITSHHDDPLKNRKQSSIRSFAKDVLASHVRLLSTSGFQLILISPPRLAPRPLVLAAAIRPRVTHPVTDENAHLPFSLFGSSNSPVRSLKIYAQWLRLRGDKV